MTVVPEQDLVAAATSCFCVFFRLLILLWMNIHAKAMNSIVKATNSIAKVTNYFANGTNSIAKAMISIAKICNTLTL